MRIGSLFSGYGGLCEFAVAPLLGGTVAWHCENNPDASKILAHHWPDVPNHHDITATDWSQVEPVDILTGGFPCQDLSHAGKRLGLRPGTRSGLWSHMAYAVSQLRPRLVVIENVRGLLSAEAHGDLEPCPWCVGDDESSPLRALGAVLGDLAGLGYDAQWCLVRASDVGAPHQRRRVFIVAAHADGGATAHADLIGHEWSGGARRWGPGPSNGSVAAPDTSGERHGRGQNSERLGRVDGEDASRTRQRERSREVAGDRSAATAADADRCDQGPVIGGTDSQVDGRRERQPRTQLRRPAVDWGIYEPAIRRWEALTRPAPPPTEPGAKGQPRLSPRFVEFLMGLPAGHVTNPAIGISRNAQLKALGNGVVPQQAALALTILLNAAEAVA